MALLDAIGKSVHAPIYQLLGGPTRFKARVMTPLEGASEAELLASLERAQAAGFRAFSVPLSPTAGRETIRATIFATLRRLEKLRAAAKGPADFVLAGTGELNGDEALALSGALEQFGLLWFDEPCAMADLASLTRNNVSPIGYGRKIHQSSMFLELLRDEAADVIRPDIGLNGISQIRRMAAIAETYYVAVAPYHDAGPVTTAASLHLAASLPNFFIQQIPHPKSEPDRRMRADLAGPSLETIDNGFAALPTGDGLGITVNEDALEKYREPSS